MKVRTNQMMNKLLGPEAIHPDRIIVCVPDKMLDEIRNGFEEIDDCVVAKGWFGASIDKAGDNEAGVECLLSKVHVDSFVDAMMPLKEMVRIGVAYALKLKDALAESGVVGPFRIIIAGNNQGNTCTVRFHRLRARQAWLASDLDGYSTEAVMAIDFDRGENSD